MHCTDGDPENEIKAADYLRRAGLADRVQFHVGDAVEELGKLEGEFDVIFNDIDKDGYPAAWRAAGERIRVGRALRLRQRAVVRAGRRRGPGRRSTPVHGAVLEHNRLIAEDERYVSTIVPTRDGVMVAIRIA